MRSGSGRSSAAGRAPTSSPGKSDRSIDLPVHDAHSLYLEAFAELGVVGGLLVLGLVGILLWCGFTSWRAARGASARALRGPVRGDAGLRGGRRLRLVLGAGRPRSGLFPRRGCPGEREVRPARIRGRDKEPRRRTGGAMAWRSRDWRRPGSPPWHWSGRCWSSARSRPARRRPLTGNIGSAIDRAESRPLDRALGGLALRATGSPRRAAGRLPERDQSTFTHAIEREDRNWQLYYLRARVEGAAGDTAAAQKPTWSRPGELNPRAPELQVGAR